MILRAEVIFYQKFSGSIPCTKSTAALAIIENGLYVLASFILNSKGSVSIPDKVVIVLWSDSETLFSFRLDTVSVFLGFIPQLMTGVLFFSKISSALRFWLSQIPIIPFGSIWPRNLSVSSVNTAAPALIFISVILCSLTTVNKPFVLCTVLSEI